MSPEVAGPEVPAIPLDDDTWYTSGTPFWPLPDMPAGGRSQSMCGVLIHSDGDPYLHVVGGFNGSNLDRHEALNLRTLIWDDFAAFPVGIRGSGNVVYDNKLYILSGFDGARTVACRVYDPDTDSWASIANCNSGLFDCRSSLVNDTIHIVGGSPSSGQQVATHQIYDINTDSWSVGEPAIGKRGSHFMDGDNSAIFIAGGDGGSGVGPKDEAERFDVAGDVWVSIGDLPTNRLRGVGCFVGGYFWVLAGTSGTSVSSVLASSLRWTPESSEWQAFADIPVPVMSPGGCVYEGICFVVGGQVSAGYRADIQAYVSPAGANRP